MKRGSHKGGDADITVVIPAYRSLPTISRAIDSALAQCAGRVRVVVVVDDCSEETRTLVESRGDERITLVVNERNLGAPASRNRGLALSTTPFVAFLDGDDFLEGDLLAPLLESVRAQKADMGFGPSALSGPRGHVRHFVPDFTDNEDIFRRWFGKGEHVNNHSVLWSADYLRSIGGWDEAVLRNQDGELALRAILLGARFAQSASGMGVWCNHGEASRISVRSDNLGALLDVVARLERLDSGCVSALVRREATAAHLHNIALRAFRAGEDAVGDEAMRRRRALGYADSQGSLTCRAAVALRRLPKTPRRIVWRAGAALLRLVGRASAVQAAG